MDESQMLTWIWVACDVLARKHDRVGRGGRVSYVSPNHERLLTSLSSEYFHRYADMTKQVHLQISELLML